jgi:hypothetical protein
MPIIGPVLSSAGIDGSRTILTCDGKNFGVVQYSVSDILVREHGVGSYISVDLVSSWGSVQVIGTFFIPLGTNKWYDVRVVTSSDVTLTLENAFFIPPVDIILTPVSITSAESFGTPTIIIVRPSEFQDQMEVDLEEVFYAEGEFAEDILWYHTDGSVQSFRVIFDNQYVTIDPQTQVPVMSSDPMFSMWTRRLAPQPAKGDYVTVRGRQYDVIEWQSDGTGVSMVTLQNRMLQ